MNNIFLNSLPKSGTHLVAKLLCLVGYSFSGSSFSSASIHGRHYLTKCIVRGTAFPFLESLDVGLDYPTFVRKSWVLSRLTRLKEMQYLSGHAPYSDLLFHMLNEQDIKVLQVMRDPGDVLLSWAHYVPTVSWHYGRKGLLGLSLDDRVRKLLFGYRSGNYQIKGFANILTRVQGWVENASVHVVRFENLVGARGGGSVDAQRREIRDLLEFIGIEGCETEILSEHIYGGTKTFRKGKIGAWKDELSCSVIKDIEEVLGDKARNLGHM